MKKINVAELLRNCPSGMELDCTTWENVTFEEVRNNTIIIRRNNKEPYFDTKVNLNQYGCCTNYSDEKCRIFPKGKTTWEGFVPPCHFKDGDILFVDCSDGEDKGYQYIFILNKPEFYGKWHSYCHLDGVGDFHSIATYLAYDEDHPRFATEEEKEKLFKVIKDNGYEWNSETKTLEKLIKQEFKDGDVVVSSLGHIHILKNRSTSYIFVDFVHNSNGSLCKSLTTGVRVDRLATEEEKAKLFQVIKDNGYRWNEETKTLEELPKFKVGDRIRNKKGAPINISNVLITKVNKYSYEGVIGDTTNPAHINFKYQDLYELMPVEPTFNVGDRIRHKNDKTIHTINYVYYDNYALCDGHSILFKDQDQYELMPVEPQFKDGDVIFCENHWGSFISIFKENVTERNGFIGHCVLDVDDNKFKVKDSASYFNKVRFATKRETELLFRAIKKNGYKWNPDNKILDKSTPNPDKFDITSLKTFDQVLVRDFDNTPWEIEFFSRLLDGKHFKCFGLSYMQCIPYKGNEHLNGKKDDCDKYFKTWE